MAITPQNNDVFMREVDEELRRDEMVAFGRKYGVWIAVLAVLFLLALGGGLWWRHHKEAVAGRQGEQFQTALDSLGSGDLKAADPTLAKLAASSSDGYRAMALFTQADVLLKKDDLKGAAAKFAAIANDSKFDAPFRDLALIRQTSAEYETLDPQTVIDRLKPLAVKDSPWFGSAGELVAMAYVQQNKRAEAGTLFSAIAQASTTPDSLRQRAVQMASLLNDSAGSDNKDKAAK
ncbi:tetratricopeptide repeat protein [Hephaestia mangrovi]|uniref:tetratricopeptide repeat protein n=1 Tax=Hephaestia mangrovi TaxID=2873268 RepID=UPI001CA62904|nr:tetratricopeptide repeat protein [Hephaestia mangrovi]MBY8827188.1 tetratricopeptide repeat protein [Hephaestia mangrovi]